MIDFLIVLAGVLVVLAAVLSVIFGHRRDTYKALGHIEEAAKSYKIMWCCYGYIFLWVVVTLIFPLFFL